VRAVSGNVAPITRVVTPSSASSKRRLTALAVSKRSRAAPPKVACRIVVRARKRANGARLRCHDLMPDLLLA